MAARNDQQLPSYYPDRTENLGAESASHSGPVHEKWQIPPGFPEQLDGPLVWTKEFMMAQGEDWIILLNHFEQEAIISALRSFQGTGLHVSKINKKDFPLPKDLAERLDSLSEECYNGRGFCIIRGLNSKLFLEEEHAVIYAGITLYVCSERGFQDFERKSVLCHIKNSAPYIKEDEIRSPAFTDGAVAFHTDLGDILSLYVIDQAPRGGRTLLASSWQVYNELAQAQPQVLHTLASDWTFDTFYKRSQYPPYTQPLLHYHDGKVIFQYSRRPFTGFGSMKRDPSLPSITPAQIDALDSVHHYAEKNSIALNTTPGDIVYINNMSIFHARESYEHAFKDEPDDKKEWHKEGERHLLKFFLRDPERAWKMPPSLQEVWQGLYGPNQPNGSREEVWVLKKTPGMPDLWQVNG